MSDRLKLATRTHGLLLSMAAAVWLMGSTGFAKATEITFDVPFSFTMSYTEAGYQFDNNGYPGLSSWPLGDPRNADPSGVSATVLNGVALSTTTLTKVGGGAFKLKSMDVGDPLNIGIAVNLNLTFNFAAGGSTTVGKVLDSLVGLETFSFALAAVDSVSWTTVGYGAVQWDNVKVDAVAATPIPASLPLFASALGGLGFFAWRRRGGSD